MVTISDLSCRGKNGKQVYGTAAILRRMFSLDEVLEAEREFEEYKKLIHELGYDGSSDE